jgi:DNA-binding CsgD family transcriptional regulator
MGSNYGSKIVQRGDTAPLSSRSPVVSPITGRQPKSHANGLMNFGDQGWVEVGRTLNLSGRQLQIVRGMFDDKIQYSIAADLGISPHTVHTHIERLYRKLGVTNRAQLLMRVMTEFVTLVATRKIAPPAVSVVQAAQR